jgi:hypothetical protein
VPILLSPADNSTGVSITPALTWNPVTGTATYNLQIATDANFTTIIKDTSQTGTTYNVTTALKNSTKYYWRVSATNTGGTSNYSSSWNFTTIVDTPVVVELKLPLNNSTENKQPLNLSWDSSKLAASYKLQVSTDSNFTTTMIDTSGLTDTTFTLTTLSNLTKYYWRVKAINEGGESQWSEVWNFKTLGKPTTVTLLAPIDNAKNQPLEIRFCWSKSEDKLEIIKSGEASNNPLHTEQFYKSVMRKGKSLTSVSNYWFQLTKNINSTDYVANDSTLADTTTTISGLDNSTKYFWRVSATNEAGWNNFSGWFSFTTIIHLPGVVTLISPVDSLKYDSTMTHPEFLWGSDSLAKAYTLQLSYQSNFNNPFFTKDSLVDTLFTLSVKLDGDFYWRVRGSNIAGSGKWSEPDFVKLIITGVNDFNEIPKTYSLSQNYPNPFNPTTVINYSIPKRSFVTLKVYDILGREISTLVNEEQSAGNYKVTFNGVNLPSGVYFYRLSANGKANNFVETKKLVLLK